MLRHKRLESFLIQKSKEDWLNLGGTNDKYFFDKLKLHYHYKLNLIYQLEDGNWTWDYEKVIQNATHYYEDFLGSPTITSILIDKEIIAIGPCLSSS